jgi:hypothetical protein
VQYLFFAMPVSAFLYRIPRWSLAIAGFNPTKVPTVALQCRPQLQAWFYATYKLLSCFGVCVVFS